MMRSISLLFGVVVLSGCSARHAAHHAAPATADLTLDAGKRADAGADASADAGVDASAKIDAATDPALPITRSDATEVPESPHPDVVRIVDWNIKATTASSINAIAARLEGLEPDVIVLQEVDVNSRRSRTVDQPAVLGAAFGFNYAFAKTLPFFGGDYGIATLSRYPFESLRRIALTNQNAAEKRAALDATICATDFCMRVINHHADTRPQGSSQSILEIVLDIANQLGTGILLMADLNQAPADYGPTTCVAVGLVDLGQKYGDTATDGGRRIDYAFADSALAPCVKDMFVVSAATESDHFPLVVDFDRACLRDREPK